MHIGMSASFNSVAGSPSDAEIYAEQLRLVDMAEPLGFESVWAVEHHFTDYNYCPNPLQFLTYVAGRTEKVKLGTMAVIIPWHDPVRVAEQVACLDVFSRGRVILGLGRGLAKVEFEGFRTPIEESRARYNEYASTILRALDQGYIESDGPFAPIPRRELRPRPYGSFKGRAFGVSVSPESFKVCAALGMGALVIPQKPWEVHAKELDRYTDAFVDLHGHPPPSPITSGHVFIHEDEAHAKEQADKFGRITWDMTVRHYEFTAEHLKRAAGYEYYKNYGDILDRMGPDRAAQLHVDRQIAGTPVQVFERLMEITSMLRSDSFIVGFSSPGEPIKDSEHSMELFARAVLPRLQAEKRQIVSQNEAGAVSGTG